MINNFYNLIKIFCFKITTLASIATFAKPFLLAHINSKLSLKNCSLIPPGAIASKLLLFKHSTHASIDPGKPSVASHQDCNPLKLSF